METIETGKRWPTWMIMIFWGTFVLFALFDIFSNRHVTLGWFLRYLTFPLGMVTQFLQRTNKIWWLLNGAALGIFLVSVIVDLYFRHFFGTLLR
jgi:hypothetical protein